MSDEQESQTINEQLVLISGESSTGKSASLRNIRNQERWMFLNTEAGKRLPFQNKFDPYKITEPYQVHEGLDFLKESPDHDGGILDTLTFLMDMYESQYVMTATNTQTAWGQFAKFFKDMMLEKVASLNKPFLILAHTKSELDEVAMEMRTAVPIKGSLRNNGIESYFSTVVSTKKVSLKKLEPYKNDMLNITEEDEMLGYKHVFQTRLTKETVGERIRSPMGMFTKEQTFIDNDVQILLDHMHTYYG